MSPAPPSLTKTASVYELGLATISVMAGGASIVQENITDTRMDPDVCGWVTGIIDNIDTSGLFAQFYAEWEYFKGQMSAGDIATSLQFQITNISNGATPTNANKINSTPVSLDNLTTGQALVFDGSNWVNGTGGLTEQDLNKLVFAVCEEGATTPRSFNGVWIFLKAFIPSSVTTLPTSFVQNCYQLANVFFADNSQLLTIGNSAFANCTGLTKMTLPYGVTSIQQTAFSGCVGLTTITLPSSIINITANAFQGCTGLTSVTLGQNFDANLDVSASKAFTATAIVNMINAYKNNVGLTAKILTVGADNLAKLTTSQKQIAIDKNLTLA